VQPDSSTFNKALTAAGEAVLWQLGLVSWCGTEM